MRSGGASFFFARNQLRFDSGRLDFAARHKIYTTSI